MTVPYTFGTATTSIPLSNLDANFNTPITLGNTSIYLGNTTTTIGNLTLTNVTISSGTANITSNITYATANAVVFTNASSIGTTSANLTFNGTTFTANTIGAFTLGGTIAGGGNQINNVIIGNSTPLAGSFTTVTTSGAISETIASGNAQASLTLNDVQNRQVVLRSPDPLGTQAQVGTTTNHDLELLRGGVAKLTVSSTTLYTASGVKVGIGLSNPATTLDIVVPTGTASIKVGDGTVSGAAYINLQGVTGAKTWFISSNYNVGGALEFTQSTANGGSTIAGTASMLLDASGNLGLGATPSAWTTNFGIKSFDIVNGCLYGATADLNVLFNAYYNGTNFIYKTTEFATNYTQVSGQHQWFSAPSGTAGAVITFTQAMTLDASSQLSVGTTSAFARLTTSRSPGSAGQVNGQIAMTHDGATTAYYISTIRGAGTNEPEGLTFKENATERMRIDSSGNLLVGTTTAKAQITADFNGSATNGIGLNDTASANGTVFASFWVSSTSIGSIQRVTTTNAVVYNTTSDYRLKTVTGSVTGQGERIDALKPIDYQWKEGNQQARGFLAHEFQTVYPNSVSGEKDAIDSDGKPVYQAMQASTAEVIADLVAEIQSLRQRITTLENK